MAPDVCKPVSDYVTYPMPTADDLAETARLVEATGRTALVREVDIRDLAAQQQLVAEAVRTVRPPGYPGGQRRNPSWGGFSR